MNKRAHKKALKKARENGDTKKVFDLTHKGFIRNLKRTISEYDDLIKSDMPNCTPAVQQTLARTDGRSTTNRDNGSSR